METVSKKIRPISNIKDNKFQMPSLEFLYKFRVVICTLLTAGSIVRCRRISKDKFRSTYFSHVIIDEAACCHETVSLVAIAGQHVNFFVVDFISYLMQGVRLQLQFSIIV